MKPAIAAHHADQRNSVAQRDVLLGSLGQAVLGAILGNGQLGQKLGQFGTRDQPAGGNRRGLGSVTEAQLPDLFRCVAREMRMTLPHGLGLTAPDQDWSISSSRDRRSPEDPRAAFQSRSDQIAITPLLHRLEIQTHEAL